MAAYLAGTALTRSLPAVVIPNSFRVEPRLLMWILMLISRLLCVVHHLLVLESRHLIGSLLHRVASAEIGCNILKLLSHSSQAALPSRCRPRTGNVILI